MFFIIESQASQYEELSTMGSLNPQIINKSNYSSSDWTAVTRNVEVDHDLEATPLQILTNAKVGEEKEVGLDVQNIGRIDINFTWKMKYRGFSISSCGNYPFPGHLPKEVNKIWTISRTKEAVTILSNEVEVLNVVFTDVGEDCEKTWSGSSTKIIFTTGDLASDYKRTLIQGMAYLIIIIIKKLYCLTNK